MDANCTLVCCEEEREDDKAVIVQFSNGTLRNTQQLDFSFYKNVDETNPRKKNRRLLVAESDRLSYVGNNFGTGSLKCNNLCKYYVGVLNKETMLLCPRYYVGVLNKETMRMEVHNAQLFNMQPVIPGESSTENDASQNTDLTYREKVDSLIEAFGTNKQKRALTSRRLNQVGSETLQSAVAKAAHTIIDQKGLEALQQEVVQAESQSEVSHYLPPCYPDADTPQHVYLFDDILSPVEYDVLDAAGSKMAALTPEELQNLTDEGCQSVVSQLESLPREGVARERHARCAFYLLLLLKLARQKNMTRKFGQEEGCPRIIHIKLMRTFTVETFNNGRVHYVVSTSMRVKVAAYCLALLLHMGDMTADLTLLHRDLGVTEKRMVEVAKSMGLTLSRHGCVTGDDGGPTAENRLASLRLPLVKYQTFTEIRKRKKMH
ncbi:DNA-directed RNA polymerase I subunit RPA49 isoform X1 [Oncorhynchus tshawytscha]|uniref:DNA-directed RNA polymerase I subunit RPA49 isoform X1 n=1 Tax=Oncorhynchus tshawytscha TaxID=74940 RepID=UPI001C3DE170|nr:DNA-directed RNA polymerase I subunit RPA49 isoform X1 [Oncorhynchus tshawytscha]